MNCETELVILERLLAEELARVQSGLRSTMMKVTGMLEQETPTVSDVPSDMHVSVPLPLSLNDLFRTHVH